MTMAPDSASSSLLISSGITLIAVFLGLRQWYERRARETDISDLDRRYFQRQDVRRGLGVAVMLVLALGLYIGCRIPHMVAGKGNLAFVEVWLVIAALILVLLFLAALDWIATRIYARRQVRSLVHEKLKLLQETMRKAPVDAPEQGLD